MLISKQYESRRLCKLTNKHLWKFEKKPKEHFVNTLES